MATVAVIDYGMGNLHSIEKALKTASPASTVIVSADKNTLLSADHVVFPGVGAIRDCMAEIRRLGIDELVREVSADRPLLGICVGMQALMSRSEENGWVDCIDLFQSEVRFFGDNLTENGERLKVPHMGWNEVHQTMDHPLWQGIPDGDRFYFVHSYYAEAEGNPDIAGRTHYGVDLAAAVARALGKQTAARLGRAASPPQGEARGILRALARQ